LAPTHSPTGTPVEAPTCSGSNNWHFKVNGVNSQGCGWVGNFPNERCLYSTGAKQNCAQICCGFATDEAPVMAPTVIEPTPQAPQAPQACVITDWTFKINDQSGRGCGWVSQSPDTRCLQPGAVDNCAICCDIAP